MHRTTFVGKHSGWLIAGFYYPCLGAFWDTRGLKLPWSYQCCLKIANSCLYLNSLLRAFTLVNFHQSEPKIVKSQSLLIFEVCLKHQTLFLLIIMRGEWNYFLKDKWYFPSISQKFLIIWIFIVLLKCSAGTIFFPHTKGEYF